jgi:hypothetical protein
MAVTRGKKKAAASPTGAAAEGAGATADEAATGGAPAGAATPEGGEASAGAAAEKGPGKAELAKLERMGDAFEQIERLLFRLGQQGLQRMSKSSIDELGALEQTAHNGALTKIERQIGTLSTHVERYLAHDPLFTIGDYMDTVNRIWLLCGAARRRHAAGQTPDEMSDIIGEARRSYEEIKEPLLLQPLGATGWVSDTDFVGITVYFYVDGKPGVIYEAANCKPCAFAGRDPSKLMNREISDYVSSTIFDVAHGAFEFRDAKLSADGRLSLHKDLKISKAPYIGARAYASVAVRDWVDLVDRLRAGQLNPVERAEKNLVFVEPALFGEVVIDEKNARATVELADKNGALMLVEVPLREENNLLIDNLERMLGRAQSEPTAAKPARGRRVVTPGSARKLTPDALFGRAWVADGRLKLAPFTALYNNAIIHTRNRQEKRRLNEIHLSLESTDQFSHAEE